MARRYSGDPYHTVARFKSTCSCGAAVAKGAAIFYYPSTRSVKGDACGCAETAANDFGAMAADEDFCNGGSSVGY